MRRKIVGLPLVDNHRPVGFDEGPLERRLTVVPERNERRVTFSLEGREVEARAGETVAVSLLACGERVLSRSVKYHRPRGFFCLSGHCGACLTRIDGKPNMKA